MILNLDLPENPVERVVYLDGVMAAVRTELDELLAQAYFDARIQGMLPAAIDLNLHARKRIMAWTRRVNEQTMNRSIRWNDGLK